MFDVIIVGAGLSGLTTAYKIIQKEASLKIEILEASPRIGGQIASERRDDKLGGKWFIADQNHIFNFLSELKIPIKRRIPVSRYLQRSWSIDSGHFAAIAKYELKRYMSDLDLKSQLYRPGTYVLTSEDREYTMWKHIQAMMFFESSRVFMKNVVRLVTGVEANDVCYVEFMNILHGCGGFKTLMQLYIEPTTDVLEFSSNQLMKTLEARLVPIIIKKGSEVIQIQNQKNFVQLREVDGTVHTASVAILAISYNQLANIFVTPPIPSEWNAPYLADKYLITSFMAKYNEAYWRRKGLSGSFYSADPAIFAQQYNVTSLVGYILHKNGLHSYAKSIVLRSLAERFGNEMLEPIEYEQQTFEQTSLLNLPQTAPWNRLIWSSTSNATMHRGCLSGAVQSGLRAAVYALLILRPQNVNWQDLAEVQKASVVYRYPSFFDLFKSSLNVYNTIFYTLIGLVTFCVIKNRNKFLNIS